MWALPVDYPAEGFSPEDEPAAMMSPKRGPAHTHCWITGA